MRRLLIDTNIYVAFKKNDPGVVAAFRHLDLIGMSLTVIAELYAGFLGGAKEKSNRTELESFLDSPRVHYLEIDLETAEVYARVFHQLKTKGAPIPSNNIWIAASAIQHGLPLYTFDKHFAQVEGLMLKTD